MNDYQELLERMESKPYKTVFTHSPLYHSIKKQIENNQSPVYMLENHYSLSYYVALFYSILEGKKDSIDLSTILRSIQTNHSDAYTYFLKEVLLRKDPPSIRKSNLKTLIKTLLSEKK